MGIKAVLFDLDGTLLSMDQEMFVKTYFHHLAVHLAARHYDSDKLRKVFWDGVSAMIHNDGQRTNEEAFWKIFQQAYGEKSLEDKPYIQDFYRNEFNQVQSVCQTKKEAKEIVSFVKERNVMAILATNPLFPHEATENRIRWAGLEPSDFTMYTTYETSHFCKPNIKYFEEILEKNGLEAKECVMVGNDVEEDIIPTKQLGIQNFLLTDCIINKQKREISEIPHGNFKMLKKYLENIL